MNIGKSMIIAITALGIISACGDKKAKETKNDAVLEEKAVPEMSAKVSETEAEIEAAKESAADSLRKVDSLRQVKEHGHAH